MTITIIRAMESVAEPSGLRIRHLGDLASGERLDLLSLTRDGANLEALVLGSLKNFKAVKGEEYVRCVTAG